MSSSHDRLISAERDGYFGEASPHITDARQSCVSMPGWGTTALTSTIADTVSRKSRMAWLRRQWPLV